MTHSEKNLIQYNKRRTLLVEILGGKCAKCGGIGNLEFDHIDKTTKSFSISKRLSYNINTVLAELAKCQLLCNRCHKLKNKNDNGEAKHGSISMYRHHKCRCASCCEAWSVACKRWKSKSALVELATRLTLDQENRGSRP